MIQSMVTGGRVHRPCCARRIVQHNRLSSKLRRATCTNAAATAKPLPAGKRFKLSLPKPLGMVLEEFENNLGVFVYEVKKGGPADRAGVQPNDILLEVSAVTLKAGAEGEFENEGYGKRPYDNWQKTTVDCTVLGLKDITKAISSNNPRWGFKTVDLVILRPQKAADEEKKPAAEEAA